MTHDQASPIDGPGALLTAIHEAYQALGMKFGKRSHSFAVVLVA